MIAYYRRRVLGKVSVKKASIREVNICAVDGLRENDTCVVDHIIRNWYIIRKRLYKRYEYFVERIYLPEGTSKVEGVRATG